MIRCEYSGRFEQKMNVMASLPVGQVLGRAYLDLSCGNA